MNIKEAKQEILDSIEAYLLKDETGEYAIPTERQRPILLMGPPGIGKTAIMEQVAAEAHINLVSYTITHHTRQSAIGLPFISRHTYDGTEYSVTEYTMSEIIASIYDQIERSGIREGILFLDEINCVSETLSPTMLQFLQYKTFGTHRVPEGFLIVTAGNPPQYNKSVRDFDIVTLDRVKKIDIDVDYDCWKEYAYKAGVHGSILGYLAIRREDFYSIRNEAEARCFVTARGWEDLSRIITVYEKLGKKIDKDLVLQYIQDPEIAENFSSYYELWNKYRSVYQIDTIYDGSALADPQLKARAETLAEAPFDEKLSILSMLIDGLSGEFREYAEEREIQKSLFEVLGRVKKETAAAGDRAAASDAAPTGVTELIREEIKTKEAGLKKDTAAKLLSREDERVRRLVLSALRDLMRQLAQEGNGAGFDAVRSWFSAREKRRGEKVRQTGSHLTNTFEYLAGTFGEGQELVLFLSELSGGYYSLKFVHENGNDAYYKYNKLLLLKDRRDDLREEIMAL